MKLSQLLKQRWQRRLARCAAVTLIVLVIYNKVLLPRLLHWGATKEECERMLPGDELIAHKEYRNTLAVTVHARPSQIWPWIAQMGLHKGGFYSYTWLENAFGCRLHNADEIHSEWQRPEVGYVEPVCASQEGKLNSGWRVAIVEPNKALVWQGVGGAEWIMGVYIDSINAHTSRLITRQQFPYPKRWSVDWWIEELWMSWAHCVMQRGMLSGIKTRVEHVNPEDLAAAF
jgi:hypothetical protein